MPHSSRGAAFGDIDNDGDVDVLVMNMNEPPSLLRNDYRGANRWLTLRLDGAASNRAAIGATVIVTAGGATQARAVLSQSSYYSHDDLRLHFGLGDGGGCRADRGAMAEWRSAGVDQRAGPPDPHRHRAAIATHSAAVGSTRSEARTALGRNWLQCRVAQLIAASELRRTNPRVWRLTGTCAAILDLIKVNALDAGVSAPCCSH